MKSVFEELGGTYHNEGDYLIPDIVAPEAPHIGVWGRERKHYLQQYHNSIYTALLLSGKLNAHLEEIDRSANEMFDLLMKQCADRRRDRTAQSTGSNGVGPAHEQHPGSGGGSNPF